LNSGFSIDPMWENSPPHSFLVLPLVTGVLRFPLNCESYLPKFFGRSTFFPPFSIFSPHSLRPNRPTPSLGWSPFLFFGHLPLVALFLPPYPFGQGLPMCLLPSKKGYMCVSSSLHSAWFQYHLHLQKRGRFIFSRVFASPSSHHIVSPLSLVPFSIPSFLPGLFPPPLSFSPYFFHLH